MRSGLKFVVCLCAEWVNFSEFTWFISQLLVFTMPDDKLPHNKLLVNFFAEHFNVQQLIIYLFFMYLPNVIIALLSNQCLALFQSSSGVCWLRHWRQYPSDCCK